MCSHYVTPTATQTQVFTALKRSCRKVMFLVACVCLSVHRRSHVTISHDALDLTTQGPHSPRQSQNCSTWTSQHRDPKPWLSSYRDPLVLTYGGYWSTYGWQASGSDPTGMVSCNVCSRCRVVWTDHGPCKTVLRTQSFHLASFRQCFGNMQLPISSNANQLSKQCPIHPLLSPNQFHPLQDTQYISCKTCQCFHAYFTHYQCFHAHFTHYQYISGKNNQKTSRTTNYSRTYSRTTHVFTHISRIPITNIH